MTITMSTTRIPTLVQMEAFVNGSGAISLTPVEYDYRFRETNGKITHIYRMTDWGACSHFILKVVSKSCYISSVKLRHGTKDIVSMPRMRVTL